MNKLIPIFFLLILISCSKKNNKSQSSINSSSIEKKSLNIIYLESRITTLEKLKKIWETENISIANGTSNFNGTVTKNITILVIESSIVNPNKKEEKAAETVNIIKTDILNYQKYDELKIIWSFANNEETRTTKKTFIISEL